MIKKIAVSIVFMTALPFVSTGFAASDAEQDKRIEQLLEMNEKLAKRVEELENRLAGAEKGEPATAPEGAGAKTGFLSGLEHRVDLGGRIEFGGVWQDQSFKRASIEDAAEDRSDLTLSTVEITANAEITDWVNAEATLLYEDATFGDETSLDVDVAAVTIGDTEQNPLYLTLGKLYVPFGALLTHFPDDPLWDSPVTLGFGETSEKAALLGLKLKGLTLSAYGFNGDMDETGDDNRVEDYGFDANFSHHVDLPPGGIWGKGERFRLEDVCDGFDLLVGASYISDLGETDGFEDALGDVPYRERAGGAAAYIHLGYRALFLDAEYMAAVEEFDPDTLAEGASGARPSVWNIETGLNLCTFPDRVLEVAFQYAGSDETGGLGFPESRYGVNLNQEIFKNVVASLGYAHDEYHDGTLDDEDREMDDRDIVFSQVAVDF